MQILQTIWTALTTENDRFITLISIPLIFIEVYIFMLIFTTIFRINTTKKKKLLYVLSFSISSCLSRFIIPEPYGVFINLILCPILIIILFKTSILKAIFSEIIPTFVGGIIDLILSKLFAYFFNMVCTTALNIPIYRIIFSAVEYTCLYLIYLLIRNLNLFTSKDDKYFKQQLEIYKG